MWGTGNIMNLYWKRLKELLNREEKEIPEIEEPGVWNPDMVSTTPVGPNRARRRRKKDQWAEIREKLAELGSGVSLSPGSASQQGVSEVAQDLIKKRADQIRSNVTPERTGIGTGDTVDDIMYRTFGAVPHVDNIAGLPEWDITPDARRKEPPPEARIPLDYGQDDPDEGAYGGKFSYGSSDAAIRGLLEEGRRRGDTKERAEAGVPARDEFEKFTPPKNTYKDLLEYFTNPLKPFPSDEWGDSDYGDKMIEDQEDDTPIGSSVFRKDVMSEDHFKLKGGDKKEEKKGEVIVEEEADESEIPEDYGQDDPDQDKYVTPKKEAKEEVVASVAEANSRPVLWEAWGDFARKPGERKEAYLKSLSSIFRKAMIMNAVAALTGGTSQANAYIKFATAKLDAVEKFDQEDRLQSAWKSIMFNASGDFTPPSNYTEALARAAKLGVSPKEAKAFSALFPKAGQRTKVVFNVKSGKYQYASQQEIDEDPGNLVPTQGVGKGLTATHIYHLEGILKGEGRPQQEIDEAISLAQGPYGLQNLLKKYPEIAAKLIAEIRQGYGMIGGGLDALINRAENQQQGNTPVTSGVVIESVEDA